MPIGIQRTGAPGQRNQDARSRYARPAPKKGGQKVGNNSAADSKQKYERYLALARSAASTGDTAEIENLYQHAEHYFRLMREQTV